MNIKTIIGYSLSVSMLVGGMLGGNIPLGIAGFCGLIYMLGR